MIEAENHTPTPMKAISASIVILAASILLTGGSFIQHTDTQMFVQIVGCVVGLIGLIGFYLGFNDKPSN